MKPLFPHDVTIEHGLPAIARPIISIDIESATAKDEPDPFFDRIITLAMVKIFPDAKVQKHFWEFNPEIPISDRNAEIHGYTNEMVKSLPHFSEHVSDIYSIVQDCDFIGYNLGRYDLPLLHCEFFAQRIEWNPIELGCQIIDAGAIFKKMEQRSLSAAVRFYLGREHEGAHGAMSDAEATIEVLAAQLKLYQGETMNPDQVKETGGISLSELSLGQLASLSRIGNRRLDMAGIIAVNDDGEPVFTHAKVRGVRVMDDPGYASWLLRNDFPEDTKRILRGIMQNDQDQLRM